MKFTPQEVYEATLRSFRYPGYCNDSQALTENIQDSVMTEAISMKFFQGNHNPTSRPFDGEALYPGHVLEIAHEVKGEHAFERDSKYKKTILDHVRSKRHLRAEGSFGSVILKFDEDSYAPNWNAVKRLREVNPVIINTGYFGNDLQYISRCRYLDSDAPEFIEDTLNDMDYGHCKVNVPKPDHRHWASANPEIWLMPWRDTNMFSQSFKRSISLHYDIRIYAGHYEPIGQSLFATPTFNTVRAVAESR